jgi:Spy/CpxP family protein refolding chaperone
MKAIRLVTLTAALCAGFASVSAAQTPATQADTQRGRGMGGRILEGITLTDAQKVQQKAIREKYAPQLLKVRKDAEVTGTPIDQARLSTIQSAQIAEIRAILTAEQQVIFDRNVAEMRARMAERR